MPSVDQSSIIAYKTFNGMAPVELSKGITVDLDFTVNGSNGAAIDIDLTMVEKDGRLSFIQGVYIDNFDSGQNFVLITQISGHRLSLANGKQGFFPLFAPPDASFSGTIIAAATNKVRLIFVNFPLPAFVW